MATSSASGVERETHPCRLDRPARGKEEWGPMRCRCTPLVLRSESTQPAKSASANRCGPIVSKESPTQPTILSPAVAFM
eukprot:2065385-Alexandrium_andersonii.AAC.1